MNVRRGEVVLVDFPFPSGTGSKVRPALVVQNHKDNARLLNTVVAQITGTTHCALEPTQVLVEIGTPQGRATGLAFDSVVNCINLLTLEKTRVRRKLGEIGEPLMLKIGNSLKIALELW